MQKSFFNFYIALVTALISLMISPVTAQTLRHADQVMPLSVQRDEQGGLQLQWDIASGIYMYRDKISAEAPSGTVIPIDVTAGIIKNDLNFGDTEVIYNKAFAQIASSVLKPYKAIIIRWQGCVEDSICYPPVSSSLDLDTLKLSKAAIGFGGFSKSNADLKAPQLDLSDITEPIVPPVQEVETQETDAGLLLTSSFPMMLAAFFGFGLLLAATPCVFPMIPILSGILARSGEKLSAWRGFILSTAYVFAMAVAYAVLGLAASWSGYNLQAALQTPWALGLMAALFVALALSMFGFYELQLPAAWVNYFSKRTASNPACKTGQAGAIGGALLLGFGSALIVGPCVTPPLAAALLYVAQTGDALRGSSALFALGLGMGVPLIIFGTFGAKFLPKSGPWLEKAKYIFGVAFLGLALLMVLRLVSDQIAMLLLAITAIGCGVMLGAFERNKSADKYLGKIEKTFAIITLVYGILLMVGFAGGATDPWRPLGFLNATSAQAGFGIKTASAVDNITTIKTSDEYELALAKALKTDQPVLVDFTAEWCVTCKSNDRLMQEVSVTQRLAGLQVIKADITDYNDTSRALMQKFQVIGPPTLMFLAAKTGQELERSRIVGTLTLPELDKRLQLLGL